MGERARSQAFLRTNLTPAADVMALDYWTAPMAAAWFIWRAPDAVRDQWDRGRQGWTIWERIAPPRRTRASAYGV